MSAPPSARPTAMGPALGCCPPRPAMWSCGFPSSLCALSTLSPDGVRWRLVRLTSRADDGQVVEGEQAAGLGGSSRPHADGLASEVVPRLATSAVWKKPEGPGAALGTRSSLTATSASGRPSETGSLSWFSRLDHPLSPRPAVSGCLRSGAGADGG